MKKNRILTKALLLFVVLTMLCSCGKPSESTPNEPTDTTNVSVNTSKITIGAYDTENMNPLATKTSYNEQMNLLIYDGLYLISPKYEAIENLAAGYQIENGGKHVTITVKPNVSFHDGSPLTAHDVKATIQYLLDHPGYYSHNVRNIRSVSATDEYTVQLELSELTPNLKLQLTFPIVCKKELLDSVNFRLNGTGPYQVASQTQGKQIVLQQNKSYHKKFSSQIQEVEVSLLPDQETIRSLSGSGILDVFYAAFFDEGLKTITKYESNKFDYLTDEYTFLMLNFNTAHMQEKKFRKALYYAIDRDAIRDQVYMTHAESTYLPFPPGSWAYNDSKENIRNLEESKRLLGELGYSDIDNNGILELYSEDEKKDLVLDLLSIEDTIKKDICETLVSNLKESGIVLKVHSVSKEEFTEQYQEQKHDLYLITTNIGNDLDPAPFFNGVFAPPLELKYQEYLTKLANADKLEQKQPEYMRLCDEFYEQIPHIPLVFLKNTLLTTAKLKEVTEVYPSYLYFSVLQK